MRQLLHMATGTALEQDHWTGLDDQSYQQRRSNGLGDKAMAFDAHLQMFFCFFEKHVIQSYLVGGDWNIWMIFPYIGNKNPN